jgi:hypothetical protein
MRGTGRSRALAFTDLLSTVGESGRRHKPKEARKVSGKESEE